MSNPPFRAATAVCSVRKSWLRQSWIHQSGLRQSWIRQSWPRLRWAWLLPVAGLLLSPAAQALEPASMGTGALQFTPTLQIGLSYDDNFRAAQEAESSWVTQIRPNLLLSAEQNANRYALSYMLARDYFHSNSSENKTDHFLDASADLEFNVRNRLGLSANLSDTVSITARDEPNDAFRENGLGVVYGFGAQGAMFNIDLAYNLQRKRSDNVGNLDQERDSQALIGTLYYALGPRTQILGEVSRSEFDYRDPESELDSTNTAYRVGARWEATAFTTGSARFGRETKDFDLSGIPNKNSSTWQVAVDWAPLTYSNYRISTRRNIDEGDDESRSVVTSTFGLAWTHEWGARTQSNLGYDYQRKQYDSADDRKDRIADYTAGLTFNLRRWMDLSLSYGYTDNRSTRPDEVFDRNRFGVTLDMSL